MILDMLKEFTAAALLLLLYLSPFAIAAVLIAWAARKARKGRRLWAVGAGVVAVALLYVFLCLAVSFSAGAARARCRRKMIPACSVIRNDYRSARRRTALPAEWIGEGPEPLCTAGGRPEPYLYFAVPDVNAVGAAEQPYMVSPHPHRGCPGFILWSLFADRRPCREVLSADARVRSVPETDWQARRPGKE